MSRYQATSLKFLIISLLFAAPCLATNDSEGPLPVRLSTFGSLAIISGPDDLSANRTIGYGDTFHDGFSWKHDSLLGVQADATILPSLSATAQLVVKDRPDDSINESIEWLFVSWRPSQTFTLRTGRLGADFHMLADYRNVSYAYLWQRPPTEFYGPVLFENFDGADLSFSSRLGPGLLHAKLFAGVINQPIVAMKDQNADLEVEPFYGGRLSYEAMPWQLSTGFAHTTFASNLSNLAEADAILADPGVQFVWADAALLREELHTKDKDILFYSLGISYDDNSWQVQTELGYLDSSWLGLRSITSAYLSVGRRFGLYTPYIVLATAQADSSSTTIDPPPSVFGLDELYSALIPMINGNMVDQDTLSLGVRRDIGQNMTLKLQWDHTTVEQGADGLWWNETGETPLAQTDVDLLSLSLNWMFIK